MSDVDEATIAGAADDDDDNYGEVTKKARRIPVKRNTFPICMS